MAAHQGHTRGRKVRGRVMRGEEALQVDTCGQAGRKDEGDSSRRYIVFYV